MLLQLTISNFAIISRLDVQFKAGLNILSGETGAGKSIIISAVNLILGGRAHSDLIRSGSEEARVEALFTLPRDAAVGQLLKNMGFSFEGELLIKRHIPREGRNRIVINESLATLQTLSKIGLLLMNISGQHRHVTGVQTCALPIWHRAMRPNALALQGRGPESSAAPALV
jgi:DNA repair protein RecN (Recombination protein N)